MSLRLIGSRETVLSLEFRRSATAAVADLYGCDGKCDDDTPCDCRVMAARFAVAVLVQDRPLQSADD